tara:strand:- start:13870 stop:14217 length:348 start_codon:yes stop_codon:yes gene_type:complete
MTESPLSLNQIKVIDQLNLSRIEKHHLRLLAHCLESFKAMNSPAHSAQKIPSRQEQFDWCEANPKLVGDKEFISILLNQFSAASKHLEKIASSLQIAPLELTLEDLIADALRRRI